MGVLPRLHRRGGGRSLGGREGDVGMLPRLHWRPEAHIGVGVLPRLHRRGGTRGGEGRGHSPWRPAHVKSLALVLRKEAVVTCRVGSFYFLLCELCVLCVLWYLAGAAPVAATV